jgi:hypothetical protein
VGIGEPAQIVGEGGDHAQEFVGENGLLLVGRAGMAPPDPAHHFGDVAVGAVERLAALGAVPGNGREPPLDGAHRARLLARGRGLRRRGGEVEADHLRVRGQGFEVPAPAPGGVVAPVGGIGALRCGGLGAAGVVPGGLRQALQMDRYFFAGPRRGGRGRSRDFGRAGGVGGHFWRVTACLPSHAIICNERSSWQHRRWLR